MALEILYMYHEIIFVGSIFKNILAEYGTDRLLVATDYFMMDYKYALYSHIFSEFIYLWVLKFEIT